MGDLLSDIEKRREAGDDPCDCDAVGVVAGKVCMSCLGQKVLLTAGEYDALLLIGGYGKEDDSILDRQEFDY